ncbi:hypothetical protein B0J11DRAFT_578614 [Dendryphion nanum]|uniref:Rhodopsin domain-containing protein n=1 Tax=Dendryphion nanum TaxID=256645 RepID=A0A9P9DZQ4_9PLEO|nr:hypothetical protein B0J11DRAFT_578614 [Dendryphion nanum]
MELLPHEQRSRLTFGLIITLLILGWTTVVLRLWVRLRITKNPGWDDATMLLTLVFQLLLVYFQSLTLLLQCLFSCYCAFIVVIGEGLRSNTTAEAIKRILLYVQLGEIFYILTTTLLKISLGLFFLRLLTKRWQVVLFNTILGVSAIYGVFYAFVAIFQCGVPDDLLDNLLHGSKQCLPDWFLLLTGYIYGSINVIADWTFVLVPIVILVESDLDKRSKVSVGIVMALGAIGSISSILRMVYLKGLLLNGSVSADAVSATMWATAEPGTGIVAASVAVLRPLFRQVKAEVRDKVSEYNSNKSFRSDGSTLRDDTQLENGSNVALTLVKTVDSQSNDQRKKASVYSITSPTWDANVTFEQARIGKVINIRVTTDSTKPPHTPPKP